MPSPGAVVIDLMEPKLMYTGIIYLRHVELVRLRFSCGTGPFNKSNLRPFRIGRTVMNCKACVIAF